jgi:hypothetical protein
MMASALSQTQSGTAAPAPYLLRRREAYEARRNAVSIKKYGCSWDKYQTIRSHPAMPRSIFKIQRNTARARGIGWELTLWQWWSIWQQSGHWEERGNGSSGYGMCRLNDVGPYAADNVYIATNRENMQDYWVNRRHAASLRKAAS